jgi:uncharacterized protein GlcG (DUF336 family)
MITSASAHLILEASLAHARQEAMPPMTVAVLNAAGQLMTFQREDGTSLLREKIARGKAMGALNMGVGSRSLAGKAAQHPHFIYAVVALAGGDLVPVPGGVLIRDETNAVIGAVGVSGHLPDADEACAVAGIQAAGLVPDPGE